jgi:hypothetical protein
MEPSLRKVLLGLCLVAGITPISLAQEAIRFPANLFRWSEPERPAQSDAETREEFIETDRNSFTFATVTPGAGRLIMESAYSFIHIGREGDKHSFPETVFRYGIGDRLELRLGYNFETGRASEVAEGDITANFGINAEQQVLYGFKYAVTRQVPEFRLMPNSAFLAQAHTPLGSVEGQSQVRLGYVWGWMLRNGWSFDQAIRFGTDREREDGFLLWAPSSVLRIPLGREKRWFTHVEYFGIMTQAKQNEFSKQFVDTGLHYFVTPNFEVGTVVAFGVNDQSRGILVNVGFGIRF